jgi:hypothetical protein
MICDFHSIDCSLVALLWVVCLFVETHVDYYYYYYCYGYVTLEVISLSILMLFLSSKQVIFSQYNETSLCWMWKEKREMSREREKTTYFLTHMLKTFIGPTLRWKIILTITICFGVLIRFNHKSFFVSKTDWSVFIVVYSMKMDNQTIFSSDYRVLDT